MDGNSVPQNGRPRQVLLSVQLGGRVYGWVDVDWAARQPVLVCRRFWRHEPSGEVYAVELHDARVVGATGPLSPALLHRDNLRPGALDYGEERAAWVREHRREFTLVTPERED